MANKLLDLFMDEMAYPNSSIEESISNELTHLKSFLLFTTILFQLCGSELIFLSNLIFQSGVSQIFKQPEIIKNDEFELIFFKIRLNYL